MSRFEPFERFNGNRKSPTDPLDLLADDLAHSPLFSASSLSRPGA
jgi:hypothetical protein